MRLLIPGLGMVDVTLDRAGSPTGDDKWLYLVGGRWYTCDAKANAVCNAEWVRRMGRPQPRTCPACGESA